MLVSNKKLTLIILIVKYLCSGTNSEQQLSTKLKQLIRD